MLAARETQDRVFGDARTTALTAFLAATGFFLTIFALSDLGLGTDPSVVAVLALAAFVAEVFGGPADRTHRGIGLRLPGNPRRRHLRSGRRGHHRPRGGYRRAPRRPPREVARLLRPVRDRGRRGRVRRALRLEPRGPHHHRRAGPVRRQPRGHEPGRGRAPDHAAGRPDPHHRGRRFGRCGAGRADRDGPRVRLPPRRHRQPAARARAGAGRAPAAAPLPRDRRPLDAPLRGQHDLRPLPGAGARRAGRAHRRPLGRRRRLRP